MSQVPHDASTNREWSDYSTYNHGREFGSQNSSPLSVTYDIEPPRVMTCVIDPQEIDNMIHYIVNKAKRRTEGQPYSKDSRNALDIAGRDLRSAFSKYLRKTSQGSASASQNASYQPDTAHSATAYGSNAYSNTASVSNCSVYNPRGNEHPFDDDYDSKVEKYGFITLPTLATGGQPPLFPEKFG
ncbi:hypothetical protein L204_102520 [Cryptococcus depauperatus]|nr:hypothetical protein L204_00733 [Cryptococcus depauperatus CBS 7855]